MPASLVGWNDLLFIASRPAIVIATVGTLWCPYGAGCQARPRQPAMRATEALAVRPIGPARWWVVPHHEGNTREGKLFLGIVLENTSASAQSVALSFQSYTADGTKLEGCYGPGGGPGVAEEIAAGQRALISCSRTIVLVATRDLSVTTRIWTIRPAPVATAVGTVLEARLESKESDGVFGAYNASFRVKVASGRDVSLQALVRFYSVDGLQVATCTSNTLLVEPEVAQRAGCSSDVLLDVMSPAPTRVTVELRSK